MSEREVNKSLNLLAKTSLIVFAAIIVSKLLTYGYRIVIARFFGPEIYGVFSLAIIVLGWLVSFSALGLTDGFVRFASIYRGKKQFDRIRYIFSFSVTTALVVSVITGFALFLLSDVVAINIFKNQELSIFLKFFSFLVPITIFLNFRLALLRSFEHVVSYTLILNVVQNALKLFLLALFIYIGINTDSIIYSYTLGAIVTAVVAYFVSKKFVSIKVKKTLLRDKQRINVRKELTAFSWPIMFSSVFIGLLYWIDSLVLGYFNGTISVGFYNAAVPIIALFAISQEIFIQLLLPLTAKEYAQNKIKDVREISKQVGKWVFMLDLPLFIIIILFPGAIINLLFGSEYLVAENALRILAIGSFISFSIPISNNLLSIQGRSRQILYNLIIASIANLILNVVLVPQYGLVGAAIATSIVSISLAIALMAQTWQSIKIFPLRRKMLRISLISLIPLAVLLVLRELIPINLYSLIGLGAIFFLFYTLLIFTTGCLDRNDWEIVNRFRKFRKN